MTSTRQCRIAGCPRIPRPHRGLCPTHRTRQWRHGNPHQEFTPADSIAIDAAVATRQALPGMRPGERRAAGLRLTALGLPAQEIARIFEVEPRTVYRWRSDSRLAQAA